MPGKSLCRKGIGVKVREADVLRAVREQLQVMGFWVIRIQQGLGCHRGMPDLLAVKDGQVWWIEVKRPGGRLSESQEKFRDELEAHGGRYVVIDRPDSDVLDKLLTYRVDRTLERWG